MKTRSLLAVLISCALALFAAGCGDDNEEAAREAAAEAAAEDAAKDDSKDAAKDDSTADDGNVSSDEDSSSDVDVDSTIPSLDDLDLEGLGEQFGDCMSVSMAYAGLAMSAMGGEEGAKAAQEAAAAMKGELPKELHDDLAVVAEAFGTVAKEGIMAGSEALDSPEFEKADKNITDYLDEACDVQQ